MGKKRFWYSFLTRFFICNAESTDKKGKKKRNRCFGILKMNQRYHALEISEAKVKDHGKDQKPYTMALAIAMTAAAEAAMAAANAAADLARLVRSSQDLEWRIRTTAAIKIQSFYRAHLAWKALVGLRGVVKLQAVIRGQIVRQKYLRKLKKTHRSKLHQIRVPTLVNLSNNYTEKQYHVSPQNDPRNNKVIKELTSNRTNQMKKLKFGHEKRIEENNSPSLLPSYMATTESFMAKARSLSTPRQRLSFLDGNGLLASSSSSFDGSMKSNYKHMHF